MSKYNRDFHGWKPEDVEKEIDHIVGEVRMNGGGDSVEFITGHGSIQRQIVEQLRAYSLKPVTQWGNSGVITVVII